ncbi:putative ribonuclease H-like domain-containing protein [Tanacetum coccineum]|uniref:Ribonuclease H-like domain-containing protein n=1 Tax=Tanacetum coccineum TaxID=301880 RepID=A0ABQ5AT05_9ASTR
MAYTSNSSGSDTEVQSCSKNCVKKYEKLQKQFDEKRQTLSKVNLEIVAYQLGLESVEAQLVVHQKNEVVYEEKIAVLEFEVKDKGNAITRLTNQLEQTLKEKEDLKAKLQQFETSSKNLNKLINSQLSTKDKTGLGYGDQLSASDSEVINSVFESRSSDGDDNQTNDRFKKGNEYHAVPPPLTRNYMPLLADLSFAGLDDSIYRPTTNKTTASVSQVETSITPPINTSVEMPRVEYVRPIKPSFKKIEFTKARNEPVKSDKQVVKPRIVTQTPKVNRKDWNGKMTQKLGLGFGSTKKACFVCGSYSHLIKDCDFHEKRMDKNFVLQSMGKNTGQKEIRPVWNNTQRINHQNKFVPTAVLTRSGRIPVSTAKQHVNTTTHKYRLNVSKSKINTFPKTHSSIRRPFYKSTVLNTRVSKEKVNTVRVNGVNTAGQIAVSTVKRNGVTAVKASAGCVWRPKMIDLNNGSKDNSGSWISKRGNPRQTLKYKGIFDSGCSRHMTGNKALLTDYQDIDRGFVAFGGSTRGDKITGRKATKNNYKSSDDKAEDDTVDDNACKTVQEPANEFDQTLKNVLDKMMDQEKVAIEQSDTVRKEFEAQCDSQLLQEKIFRAGKDTAKIRSTGIFGNAYDDHDLETLNTPYANQSVGAEADLNNMEPSTIVSPIPTTRVHSTHPKAQIIRDPMSDNGTEFKNREIDEFYGQKGIKREYSVVRTPQQNGVTERKNRTLIEAARTRLEDSLLPTTPYELIIGIAPSISFMRPFGCPITILNTLDPLGKFDGKAEEGFLVGYSVHSKAFRVFNTETRKVEENLHVNFLENKPNVAGQGPNWIFDIDSLTNSMNYQPVTAGNQTNKNAGPQETNGNTGLKKNVDAGQTEEENVSTQQYIMFPLWSSISSSYKSSDDKAEDDTVDDDACKKTVQEPASEYDQALKNVLDKMMDQEKEATEQSDAVRKEFEAQCDSQLLQEKITRASSTNSFNTVSTPVNTASASRTFSPVGPSSRPSFVPFGGFFPIDVANLPHDPLMLELEDTAKIQSTGIFGNAYDDHDLETLNTPYADQNVGAEADFNNMEPSTVVSPIPTTRVHSTHPKAQIIGDPKSVISQALDDESWVEAMQEGLLQFKIQKMDVKSAFLYGTIEEERLKGDILLVQAYVDDIIFGSTKKSLCDEFKQIMHNRFQMSSMGELTFFLGLQVKQKEDGIFISQDKYVGEILKKFGFSSIRTASTPMETNKVLTKDEDGKDVDVHLYRCQLGQEIHNKRLSISWFKIKIHVDNESAICVIKNLVYHSKTKHIEIRHHFIRDSYKKRLIEMVKIHTDYNVADLLNKAFDVSRFNFLVASIGKRGRDTKIPQSGPPIKVGDEVVHKELGDIMERAATTASSLEAEQDSASLRRHLKLEDNGGVTTLPNSEIFEQLSLMGVHSLRRDEGSLSLSELMVLCTNLSNKVTSLEAELAQTKQTYSTALTKLIKKVKKLEQTVKSTQARQRIRIVVSDDEEGLEDPSKQGRKITEIDQDPSISLVQDEGTSWIQEDIEIQEKISDDTEVVLKVEEPTELVEDKGSGEKGEKEVSTVGAEHSTVIPEVSTAANLLDEREGVAAEPAQAQKIDWSDPAVLRYHAQLNRPYFEAGVWDQIQSFVPMDSEKEKGSEKKGSRKKSLARKRAGEKQSEESTKRQKIEDDIEKEELKTYLDLVPREEFAMEIESLGTKYPIVDWTTHVLTENFMYYQIIRADRGSKNYKIFSEMLNDFDRQDVMDLHKLVEERYATSRLEGYDLLLWGDLKILFQPDEEDKKKYPLTQEMLSKMLSRKLEVDHENGMAFELLRFIRSQVQK